MYFRETGQFKSRYKDELAAFPIFEDKIGIAIAAFIAFVYVPIFGLPGLSWDFTMSAVMIPLLFLR